MAEWVPQLQLPPHVEGYLLKQGDIVKSWKKRYFTTELDKILYAKKKGDKPIGVIPIHSTTSIHKFDVDEGEKNICAFRIRTPKRTYQLEASSASEMEEWVKSLSSIIDFVLNNPLIKQKTPIHSPQTSPRENKVIRIHSERPFQSPDNPLASSIHPNSPFFKRLNNNDDDNEEKNRSKEKDDDDDDDGHHHQNVPTMHRNTSPNNILFNDLSNDYNNNNNNDNKNNNQKTKKRNQNPNFRTINEFSFHHQNNDHDHDRDRDHDRDHTKQGMTNKSKHNINQSNNHNLEDMNLEKFKKLLIDFQESNDELYNEIKDLSIQNQELKKQVDHLQLSCTQKSQQITALKDEVNVKIQLLAKKTADPTSSDALADELEKTREKMMAFQSQNVFLSSEYQRVEKENELLKNTTSIFNDQMHSELSDYRKGYKMLKRKLAVIASTYEIDDAILNYNDIVINDVDTKDEIEFLKERYFMSFVSSCKLQQILAGKASSVNSKHLYLQSIKENINYRNYETWIQKKLNEDNNNNF